MVDDAGGPELEQEELLYGVALEDYDTRGVRGTLHFKQGDRILITDNKHGAFWRGYLATDTHHHVGYFPAEKVALEKQAPAEAESGSDGLTKQLKGVGDDVASAFTRACAGTSRLCTGPDKAEAKQKERKENDDRVVNPLKVLILGDPKVGKSSVLDRFVNDSFSENPAGTVGVDFKSKTIQVPSPDGSVKDVALQLWDMAGSERHRTIMSDMYKGVDGILLVCDCSDAESQKGLQTWLEDIHKTTPTAKIGLVVNKGDLEHTRLETVANIAQQWQDKGVIGYQETSAATGAGVAEAFQKLTTAIVFPSTPSDSLIPGVCAIQ